MARPIKDTPIISGEDARRLTESMENVKPVSKERMEEISSIRSFDTGFTFSIDSVKRLASSPLIIGVSLIGLAIMFLFLICYLYLSMTKVINTFDSSKIFKPCFITYFSPE